MNQVQLNPTKLSILSINRDKYWLFKSAILQLLHLEAQKSGDEEFDCSQSEEEEEEDLEDKLSFLNITNTRPSNVKRNSMIDLSSSSTSIRKKHGSMSSSLSFNFNFDPSKEIDNSSKRLSMSNLINLSESNSDDEEVNYFFHIAFTPIECTIICSSSIMRDLFMDPLRICLKLGYDDVTLVEQKFVNIQIDSGGGSDNNKRILQLTKPLSENNISLFFLSSHFSNIVLIPYHLEDKVVSILTQNNFEFNDMSGSYIINDKFNPTKSDLGDSSSTLEHRIFMLFKECNIKPVIDKKISLLLTGSRSSDVTETILKTAENIAANNVPDYFTITRTSENEVSLILPKSSKQRGKMGFQSRNLIGSTQDILNPVTINLQQLPLDSTGIVAGVASKIINGVNSLPGSNFPFELNYLSMAKLAILMIPKENVELVNEILSNVDYDNL